MSEDNSKRRSIYCDLFKDIGKQNKALEGQHYTAFAVRTGKKYCGEVSFPPFVGQFLS